MTLFLEIQHGDDGGPAQILKLEGSNLRLGRSVMNDVILPDAYVSAAHAVLTLADGGWMIADLGSENGIWINGRRISAPHPLAPGQSVQLGQTTLRRIDPAAAVAPALLLEHRPRFIRTLADKPLLVWIIFMMMLGVNLGAFYALRYTQDTGKAMSTVAAISAALVLLWAVPWAIAGRFLRGRAQFTAHVGIICVFLIAAALQTMLQGYVDFIFSDNLFSKGFDLASNFALMTLLIYASLSVASKAQRRRALGLSALFSAGVLAIILTMVTISKRDFQSTPDYPGTLQAWPATLVPAKPVDAFLQKAAGMAEKIKIKQ